MRSALGKGLDSLISAETAASVTAGEKPQPISEIALDRIKPNLKQPRQLYDNMALQELAGSIRKNGVLQPILVAPLPDGNYEIIAGERRWRAARIAELKSIPAVVRAGSEVEKFELALIENMQREDLSAMEQAMGYQRLAEEFHLTQEQIASAIGKDRAVVANTLRLLNLPKDIQMALFDGKISASHARSLAAIDDATAQQALYQRILGEDLSVRAVEQAVREHKQVAVKGHVRGTPPAKSPEAKAIEEDLQRTLARKVELQTVGAEGKKGWLKLEFYSLEDLDHLLAQLKRVSQTN
jgi:ParB family chromosome partitioning protein